MNNPVFESQCVVEYSKSHFHLACHSSLTSCFKYLQSMRRVHESLTPPPPPPSSSSSSSIALHPAHFSVSPLLFRSSLVRSFPPASFISSTIHYFQQPLSYRLFSQPLSPFPFPPPPVCLPHCSRSTALSIFPARPLFTSIARVYSRLRESRLA